LSVDGNLILSYDDFTKILQGKKPGDKVVLKAARNRQGQDFTVTLGTRPEIAQAPVSGSGSGPQSATNLRPFGFQYGGQRENVQDKQGPHSHEYGGVYKSTDGGETWTRINSVNPRPMYFSQVRVDPSDEKYLYVTGISMYRSSDGGKTFKEDGGERVHSDQHTLWIDPRDGRHMIVGCDGGFYAPYDRMDH